MAFKKKEIVLDPKEVERNNVREIRAEMDKIITDAYNMLAEKYEYTPEFIKKIHRKVIHKFSV